MNTAWAYKAAFKLCGAVPSRLLDEGATLLGTLAGRASNAGVVQLRMNLMQLTGKAPTAATVRRAVAAYARYFGQAFSMDSVTPVQLDARLIPAGPGIRQMVTQGRRRPIVLALGHCGNWDLAGAWAARNIAQVLTVAERLEPPQLFDMFVAARSGVGMHIIGAGRGEHVFSRLADRADRYGNVLVPLLADRDITGSGVQVRLGVGQALVAAGPAALAKRLDAPLFPVHISEVALGPARRSAAGIRRGYQLWVGAPLRVEDVATATQ